MFSCGEQVSKSEPDLIMAIPEYLSEAYIMDRDGRTKEAILNGPSDDYAKWSAFAVLTDKLFIFGGESDRKKVRKFVHLNLAQNGYAGRN